MMNTKKNNVQQNLIALVLFSLFLLMMRMKITHSFFLGFLVWNIFLAIIPYGISTNLKAANTKEVSKIKLIPIIFIWLIFLPNAPYIITDFIHLHHSKSILIWLDIFVLFSFSITGLLISIISLYDIYEIIKQKFNLKTANFFVGITTFLCGFGIYLGRFLRLNSWDIFTSPKVVLKHSIHSFSEIKTYFVTIGFGCFIWILFSIYKNIKATNISS